MFVVFKILFHEICWGLKYCRFFDSRDAPSFFVIYAHDNLDDPGRADSQTVRKMIGYMKKINSKCRSDMHPRLSSDYLDLRAKHDILENQFCLLPKELSHTAVDKVILFYSEVLKSYCTSREGRRYIQALKEAGVQKLERLRHDRRPKSKLSPKRKRSVKAHIKTVVDGHVKSKEARFHHVLTEIGLLDLRMTWSPDSSIIVGVDLHSTGTISDDLGFFGATQHYVNPPSNAPLAVDEAKWLRHRLFFKLLEEMYDDLPQIVAIDIFDRLGDIKSVVRPIDRSVAEWFNRSDEMAKFFNATPSVWVSLGHASIAQACYNFIEADYVEWYTLSTRAIRRRAFCDYATTYWFVHAAMAEEAGSSQDYLKKKLAGREGRFLLAQWARIFGRENLATRFLSRSPSLDDIAKAFNIPSCLDGQPAVRR